MLKLYKRGDPTRYWEAWNDGSEVTIHWGVLGEKGETREIRLQAGENPDAVIEREAKRPKAEGYRKVPSSGLVRIVIQYQIAGMGTTDDLDKRIRVEGLMDECLGWAGLGHCDGGDIGSGTMNIFCFVVDRSKAVSLILEELKTNAVLDGAIVAADFGEPKVVWPANFTGDFLI